MAGWTWFERTFNFDFPATKFPDLLERLRGTPGRVAERVAGLDRSVLTRRPQTGWSIQENVGQLLDLEPLFERRLDELLTGQAVLTGADLSNEKTHRADHNAVELAALLADLRATRAKAVARLEALAEADWSRSARHPRLEQPMRVVDQLYFQAEHDDYHLARISALNRG